VHSSGSKPAILDHAYGFIAPHGDCRQKSGA
jgi:hypothetical protein